MSTYVDYKINLLDEDDDFYANNGIAADDIVGVGHGLPVLRRFMLFKPVLSLEADDIEPR